MVNSSCSCFGCVALFAFSSITLAATEGYLSQPAMHGNTVVFVSEGDLWRADLSDDLAQPVRASRLTRGAGAESAPVFSSDGATLAFAGVYGGNTDVYVMRVDGGAPTRLTHHPEADVPLAFTNDGRIAFKSARTLRLRVGAQPSHLIALDCRGILNRIDKSRDLLQIAAIHAIRPHIGRAITIRKKRNAIKDEVWEEIVRAIVRQSTSIASIWFSNPHLGRSAAAPRSCPAPRLPASAGPGGGARRTP